jgi:selenide,water dikinase
VLILTKPLGTGIIATALKGNLASTAAVDKIVASMTALNRKAAEIIQDFDIHACTDITGFGLIGHAHEVARAGNIGICLHATSIPVFPEALEYAAMGLVPGGGHANRTFYEPFVEYQDSISDELRDILYDPQTSGGLFFSVAKNKKDALLKKFEQQGVDAFVVGRVEAEPKGKIIIISK